MFWQSVHQFDQQLTLTINSWYSAFTDPVWAFFSDKIVWIPMYVAIVALLIWKLGWRKGLVVIAAAGLTFGFCDQFSNLIKYAVGRIRPVNDEFMIASGLHILERGGGYSFFSAHAANAFGLACSTFIGAVSRIFVGKHYLGDALVGIVVGCAAGLAFGYLAQRVIIKHL